MKESSRSLILERGETATLLSTLFFQCSNDPRLPHNTAQKMADSGSAIAYPDRQHAVGEWCRKDVERSTDLIASSMK